MNNILKAKNKKCGDQCITACSSESYFYYQNIDGQLAYLSSTDIDMLTVNYGSLKFAPPIITAKVIRIKPMKKTECYRYKFLGHLPDNVEVNFIDVDLCDYLTQDTKDVFAQVLEVISLFLN